MPREIGTVVRLEDGKAIVHFNRQAACEKCGACGMVKNQSIMELAVPASPDLKPGDRVALQMDDSFFYLSTLLLYGVPLLALVGGIAGGIALAPGISRALDPQLTGALAGLGAAALSYLFIRAFNGKWTALRRRKMTVEKAEDEKSE